MTGNPGLGHLQRGCDAGSAGLSDGCIETGTRGSSFPWRGCLTRGGVAGFGGARWGGGSGRPTTGKCLFRHGGDCRRGSLWCGGGLGCYSFWRRHDGSGSACRPWVATRRWWKRDFPLLFRGTIHRDFPLL